MAFHLYFYSKTANCKSKDYTHVIFRDIAYWKIKELFFKELL